MECFKINIKPCKCRLCTWAEEGKVYNPKGGKGKGRESSKEGGANRGRQMGRGENFVAV